MTKDLIQDELAELVNDLLDRLRGLKSVVVAFSGGVDSSFVLSAAKRALGKEGALAATAVSPSLAASELAAATEFAAALGVRHLTAQTAELHRAGYRANTKSRCYFCKAEVLDVLLGIAADEGFAHVVTGTNADDAADRFRPGIRAADERGVLAPLRDTGLTKEQVRTASRRWGLPTWDKPAMPCLASRIAYGIEITSTRLHRVDAAEQTVRRLLADQGIQVRDLRVRELFDRVSVEVDAQLVDRVTTVPGLPDAVRAVGFTGAVIGIGAFRSGSLNHQHESPGRQ
jgi:pyridinium-3,5-biscarboxylic acid mononucleotide sulfurtransferase